MVDTPVEHPQTAHELAPHAARSRAVGREWVGSLVVALFVVLGVLYNLTTPVFEAPDETSHFLYVKRLADGQGLPPLRVSDRDVAQGEAHQPPLYYALGALVIAPLNTGAAEDAFTLNPHAALGQPGSAGNKNVVLHRGAASPSSGVALAVHLLRGLSTLFGAVTVALTYRIGRLLAPRRPVIAVGATALVALNPQFLFIGAAVSNDPLAAMLATATLYQALRVGEGDRPTATAAALIGLTGGLGILTKVNALAALGLIPLGYLVGYLRRPPSLRHLLPQVVGPTLVALSVALVVGGSWYARNAFRFGDPLGMRTMQAVFGTYEAPLSVGETLRVMLDSLVSYWGVFGWMNVLADEAYYVLVRVLTGMGVAGLALAAVWSRWHRREAPVDDLYGVGLAAIWVAVMLVTYAQFTRTITGPQGRLLFPAASAIAFLLSLGLCSWLPVRYGRVLVAALTALMVVISAAAPLRYIRPAYAAPRRVALEEAPADMNDLGIRFGENLFLLGYRTEPGSVQPGGELRMQLYWVATTPIPEDLTVSLRVYGRDDELIGELDSYPAMGAYPTSAWVPGEVVFDRYAVRLCPQAVAPVAARVRVGVYRAGTMEHLGAVDVQERDIGTGPEIARVRVGPARDAAHEPQFPLEVGFADKVVLEGYDFRRRVRADENVLELTFYWRVTGALDRDWTVFAHVLDRAGERVAQVDEQPLAGAYPTSFWQEGEVVKDTHTVLVPRDLAPGRYSLHVGFYLLDTGERLPIAGADPSVNYAAIGPVTVELR